MKNPGFNSLTVLAAVATGLLLALEPVAGQAPRRSEKPRLRAAPTGPWSGPRTPDGQPDMQGVWAPDAPNASHSLEEGAEPENLSGRGRSQAEIAEELANQPQMIEDPAPGRKIPYQPWAAAKRRENLQNVFAPTKTEHIEPEDRCLLMGVPRSSYRFNFQIRQIPGYVVILYEWVHAYRSIPLDGSPHIGEHVKLFNGDSRGHWEGNTLVVDVTNLNDQTWFDAHGTFHSDAMHVVERWTLVDADTLFYEATIEDPMVFTRPWKIAYPINRHRQKDYELLEEACYEGNAPTTESTLSVGRKLKEAGITGTHEHTRGFYDLRSDQR